MNATATPTTFTAEVLTALADAGADVELAIPAKGDRDVPACVVVVLGSSSVHVDFYQQPFGDIEYRQPERGVVSVGVVRRLWETATNGAPSDTLADGRRFALALVGQVPA